MSAYTKPIIRFGLLTPALFNGLLLTGVLAGMSKLSAIRQEKEERYKEHTMRLKVMTDLEAQLAPKRKPFEEQKRLLQSDSGQLFTRIVDTALPKYKDVELERSSLVFPSERGRLSQRVQCETARMKSSFKGGIGPLQEVLLQVETLMPQAMVEELKIVRKSDLLLNRPDHLVIDVTHTCWRAGEANR